MMIMIMTVTHSSILWRWVQAIRWSRPRSVTRGQLSSSRMVSLIMMMMMMMMMMKLLFMMMMMSPLPGGRRGPQLPDPLVGDQLAVGEGEGGEGGAVGGQRGDGSVWRHGEYQ